MSANSIGSSALLLSLLLGAGCSATVTATPAPPGNTCGQDSSVQCDHATGFSCAGSDTPEDSDSSLVCSDGTSAPGATLFCCVTFSSSSCAQDNSVGGCTGDSFGFSCTGTDTPDDADSTLVCSQPTQGNGVLLYCCTD
jgi:hypothetical protein